MRDRTDQTPVSANRETGSTRFSTSPYFSTLAHTSSLLSSGGKIPVQLEDEVLRQPKASNRSDSYLRKDNSRASPPREGDDDP